MSAPAYFIPCLTADHDAFPLALALAGLVPNMDPGVAITLLHQALHVQETYGAVMLSFLGALHWGFEFAGYGGNKG